MNRSLSSKAAPTPANSKTKKKKIPRNPLHDLNNGGSSSEVASSSSISIEAPKGCLRFFLSHTHTHTCSSNLKTPIRPKLVKTTTPHLSKTLKSAPDKLKNTSSSSCLPSSRNAQKFKPLNNSKPKSLIKSKSSVSSSDANITPLCKSKVVATTTVLDHKTDEELKRDSTTPPVQASVSPEIQFAVSSLSTSSSVACCYAAGHVLSGIADKRKCRPRGILNVGDNNTFCGRFDDDVVKGMLLPLPTEASMHWILSPCNEEDEEDHHHSDTSGLETFERRKEDAHLTLKDEESQCIYDFDAESSPFSMASLGSGNVIVTPQSESSPLSAADNNNRRRKQYDSELSSVAEAIRMASLSPNGHEVIEDQVDSSFQFNCLTTTCDSISRIQKMLDHQAAAAWDSSSTLENVSQSQMRVSWREGLMSRMYDMDDEHDCCKCLSDDEKETNDGCSDNDPPQKSCQSPGIASNDGGDQILTDSSCSAKVKQDFPCQSSSVCAESISIDGGGLVASGDSDWHLCYKNKLFHV